MVDHGDAVAVITAFAGVEETTSYGQRAWKVRGKLFAWDRPFRNADLARFGDEPVPEGPILAVRVGDLGDKQAILAAAPPGVFTIAHFDDHPAVLVQLDAIGADDLDELLTDAWSAIAGG